MIRLVVFDCDGTIVDSQHLIVAAMAETFSTGGLVAPTAATVRRVVGLSLPDAIGRLLPHDRATEVERLAETYKRVFQRLRDDPTTPQDQLFPLAKETLRKLSGTDYLLGVATGKSRRGLKVTLERHGLADLFATVQTADDAPSKPDPTMVKRAMSETGAASSETIVIGDTVFDMAMAANAGVRALGVAWGYHEPAELAEAGALAVLDDFGELPARLRALRRNGTGDIDDG